MSEVYDVFFSYRRADLVRARPLLAALSRAGLRPWRDQTELPDNCPITSEIRHGIASSRVLIAFYSAEYPLSRACQQEITTAWISAQLMGEQPHGRVLVINPDDGFAHLPSLLREQQMADWPHDEGGFAALAENLRRHVNGLKGTLIGAGSPVKTTYSGMAPVETPRFVGRVRELWGLHGLLTADRMSITTGIFGQPAVQLRGLGGIGKSLLVREYAIRFGAAYPGGIFWLTAYGNDDAKRTLAAEARDALRQNQVRDLAVSVGIRTEALQAGEIEAALWERLAENGRPCLWIVDDLPAGLNLREIEKRWSAQWGGASTLITTRCTDYGAFGRCLDLELLSAAEAWQLLTSHRKPEGGAEELAAKEILQELGEHPLAIEVASSYLAKGTQKFSNYLYHQEHHLGSFATSPEFIEGAAHRSRRSRLPVPRAAPLDTQFTAPGLDLGYFLNFTNDSKAVEFR